MIEVIQFILEQDRLLLRYSPSNSGGSDFVKYKLETEGRVIIRKTFSFRQDALIEIAGLRELEALSPTKESSEWKEWEKVDTLDEFTFQFGVSEGSYFKIDHHILGLKHDLYLVKDMPLSRKTFIANRDISIFSKIDALINEPIIVGGDHKDAIPLVDFELLLKTFPTSTELTHYSGSRITRILKDYFGTMSDAEGKLVQHLNRKKELQPTSKENIILSFELQKFEYIHAELVAMLEEVDSYSEKDWQSKILGLILFIFPKYVAVLKNVYIKDFYTDPEKVTKRFIDLVLVDSNGNIDIIEIKKPFSNALLSVSPYRDNYTPKKELSGAVMQAEKYLFYLNKWGSTGEREIANERKKELPTGMQLKITNPKALVLLGRDNEFSIQQRFDFEIIRRKYANMLDIMTYDDLLRRIENIIEMMRRQNINEIPL